MIFTRSSYLKNVVVHFGRKKLPVNTEMCNTVVISNTINYWKHRSITTQIIVLYSMHQISCIPAVTDSHTATDTLSMYKNGRDPGLSASQQGCQGAVPIAFPGQLTQENRQGPSMRVSDRWVVEIPIAILSRTDQQAHSQDPSMQFLGAQHCC